MLPAVGKIKQTVAALDVERSIQALMPVHANSHRRVVEQWLVDRSHSAVG
jgi:hypothetical protein